jgi:hypothetical protein
MQKFNPNVPTGPLEGRWEKHKFDLALIAPKNRKKYNRLGGKNKFRIPTEAGFPKNFEK